MENDGEGGEIVEWWSGGSVERPGFENGIRLCQRRGGGVANAEDGIYFWEGAKERTK
jgi:hypothetical protein